MCPLQFSWSLCNLHKKTETRSDSTQLFAFLHCNLFWNITTEYQKKTKKTSFHLRETGRCLSILSSKHLKSNCMCFFVIHQLHILFPTWQHYMTLCHCKAIRMRTSTTLLYLSSFPFTCSDTPIKTMPIKERIRTRAFVHLFAPKAFCSDAYSEHRSATSTTSDPLSHHPTQRLSNNLQCIPPHVNRVSMTHMSGAIQFSGRLENETTSVSMSQLV